MINLFFFIISKFSSNGNIYSFIKTIKQFIILDNEFEQLIIGYINQSLSDNDIKKLLIELNDPENFSIFKTYIKINFYSIYVMNQPDTDAIIKEIKSRIKVENNKPIL